jgi:hypothetical protein
MNHPKKIRELKNLPGRTLQLGLMAFIISVGITLYFYLLGLKMSSVMVACFSASVAIILALQTIKIIREAHTVIIIAVCTLLIVSSFIEGASTGQYFYFFPLIVVVPIVVDSKNSSNFEFIGTFSLVLVSFAVCFYIGHSVPPLEQILPLVANKIIYSNAASACFITLLFSIANVFYERKFISALQTIAHIQSHEMRKPVASIMGLMNVWKTEDYTHDLEIIGMLESAVNELDEKIHLINLLSDNK